MPPMQLGLGANIGTAGTRQPDEECGGVAIVKGADVSARNLDWNLRRPGRYEVIGF
jgi:hypothetical protein